MCVGVGLAGVGVVGIGIGVKVGSGVEVGFGVADGVGVGDDVGVTVGVGVSVSVTAGGVVGVDDASVTSVGVGVLVGITTGTVAEGVDIVSGVDVGDDVDVADGVDMRGSGGHPRKQVHTKPRSTTTAANAVASIFKTRPCRGIASSKAVINSLVVWNLSRLSFSRAFRTTCSKSEEIPGSITEGGAGSLRITADRVWLVVFSLKAAFPVNISYRTTPREKISER